MAYASDEDVQVHLPVDKLKVEEIPDDKDEAIKDADRIIRGYLSVAITDFATVSSTWVDPDTTPENIRQIAGRFAAAKIYRVRYSEDALDDPEYAQNLYNEAMSMLQGVIAGTVFVPGIDPGTDFDNTWFEPNSESDPPKFTMAGRF